MLGEKRVFCKRVNDALNCIGEEILSYNTEEFWTIQRPYEYLEAYALEHRLFNMAVALPLARGLHDGSHRKSGVIKNGVKYKLPYVFHCLMVCRMLADIHVPLSQDEEDIMLASALCHDMLEDIAFANGGTELYTQFGLDPRVYETVKCVSKRRDFTPEEECEHFHKIEKNKLALLVKLSDRGHNVEDLYNMSIWKTHEYVGETRKFFYPMCDYAKEHYPELYTSFEILQDKIILLSHVAEILVNRYEEMENELMISIRSQQEENDHLRSVLASLQD